MAVAFKFQGVLETLQEELKEAVAQQAEIERKISSLRQSVSGLLRLRDASFDEDEPGLAHFSPNPLFDATNNAGTFETVVEALGGTTPKLTEACRSALRSASEPMTAGDVR